MSEDLTPQEERDALAAELALGLLTGEERGNALRLQLSDPAFAAQVRGWEDRLAPLHGEWAAIAPHDSVWDAVAARISENETTMLLATKVRRWRAGAVLTGAVAAALAIVVVTRPVAPPLPSPIAAPVQVAMAQMTGEAGGPVVMARYDPQSAELKLRISPGFDPGPKSPELWVIPQGGKPVSLGMLPNLGEGRMTMPMAQRPMIAEGATLAVTMEPADGAPHAAPSSAPVAAGKISFI